MPPKRVQMSRQHPWRADNPDAVIVARPSKWGNPFKVVRDDDDNWDVRHDGITFDYAASKEDALELAVEIFALEIAPTASIDGIQYPLYVDIERELGGKDLACWCPLDQPCHADVLLVLANPVGETK
jgi:hypothetical protein